MDGLVFGFLGDLGCLDVLYLFVQGKIGVFFGCGCLVRVFILYYQVG